MLENYVAGRSGGFFPDMDAAREEFMALLTRFDFDPDPDAYVDALTIGERQQLEILRLLSLNVRVLILDEPTTGISAEQKTTLFNTLKSLARDEAMTIILVCTSWRRHQLCDRRMCCGAAGISASGRSCPISALVEMMFGKVVERQERPGRSGRSDTGRGAPVHLQPPPDGRGCHAGGPRRRSDRSGGLDGSGQGEFMRSCAGLIKPEGGRILVDGRPMIGLTYHQYSHAGVAFLPAGRIEEGLIGEMTLTEHFALTLPSRAPWVNWRRARNTAQTRIDQFNVKGRPASPVRTLSGGNQQRFALSLLPQNLRLLLLEHPTRGLDVESANYIWEQLLERRREGTAIVFISAELDEIVAYSDRILVFFGGRVTLVDDPDMTASRLGVIGEAVDGIDGKTARVGQPARRTCS